VATVGNRVTAPLAGSGVFHRMCHPATGSGTRRVRIARNRWGPNRTVTRIRPSVLEWCYCDIDLAARSTPAEINTNLDEGQVAGTETLNPPSPPTLPTGPPAPDRVTATLPFRMGARRPLGSWVLLTVSL
jgi:hypothetical protein